MGNDITPDPEYGANCNTCFPVDETPLFVFASVVGIMPGDFYGGGTSPCPNGIYKLHQIANCRWKSDGFPAVDWRAVDGANSILDIRVAVPGTAFTSVVGANCVQRFIAAWQNPAFRFHWGGTVQVMTLAGDAPLSIQDIANLVGVPIATDTKFDFWPTVTADEIHAKFARIRDSINILIRQDLTP